MMVLSMTGYGRGVAEDQNINVLVEMKSVNHRFCDISVRLPKQLVVYEDKIKRVVQSNIRRGKVDVFVTIEGEGMISRSLSVDWDLIDQYVQVINEANKRFSIDDSPSFNKLMLMPEVFQVIEKEQEHDTLGNLLIKASEKAVYELCEMRQKEGSIILGEFQKHLQQLQIEIDYLKDCADKVVKTYRDRLLLKVKNFLSDTMEFDESRILTEVAIYADKSDINEELERLGSHIIQFQQTFKSTESIGRKLDFLIQEMNREINTIGSKSNDVQISQTVVNVKSGLEKLKEQVQNIE